MKPPTTKTSKVRTIKAFAILYSKTKGGICHYDINFNDMPTIYYKKRTALYHANNDKDSIVSCTISYSLN